jgi:hypothetical protein
MRRIIHPKIARSISGGGNGAVGLFLAAPPSRVAVLTTNCIHSSQNIQFNVPASFEAALEDKFSD